jgi:hypothetical protein
LKKRIFSAVLLSILVISLGACQLTAPGASEPTEMSPEAVFTSAAQTAEARRLEKAATSASPEPAEIIATSIAPTATATVENPAAVITPTVSVPATSFVQPTDAQAAGEDRAEFVADVSVPDGTVFAPGEEFVKTWRLENVGSTTWTTEYTMVYIDGALMSESTTVAIPKEVAPYEKVEISVKMIAPNSPGSYRSYWKLRTADGKLFGVGVNYSETIWVDITVQSSTAQGESTPTENSHMISDVELAVDNNSVIGGCPHTFVFTGQFSLKQTSSVTYNLELGDNLGSQLKVPPPMTQNLDAGSHPVVYEITLPNAIQGWARLNITEPEAASSNQVTFELQCT